MRHNLIALGAMVATSMTAVAQQRPNILWLTYEDTSPQFIGCYGNERAHTPNIDKLAADGVRFTSAFACGAVSSASRFCLFTGIPASRMGTNNHRSFYNIPDSIEGLAYYLRQAGYYTTNNVKTDYNFAKANEKAKRAWNECSNKADWRGRGAGQPFFAIYNSFASHQSRTMTEPWKRYVTMVEDKLDNTEKVAEGGLDLPAFYANTPAMQHYISRVYNSISLTDKEFGTWIKKLDDDGLRDSTIIFCFSDHGEGLPRAKGSSTGMGYRVPFIAWIPKQYAYLSPWGISGVVTDELISFEDLVATMFSITNVKSPNYIKGRKFMGAERKPAREYIFTALDRTDENSDFCRTVTDGEYLYTKVFTPYQPFCRWNMYWDISEIKKEMRKDYNEGNLNTVQNAIFEPRECEYLFNIKKDKWETNNLANDPTYKKRLEKMRNVLKEHLIDDRDAHFIPEYSYIENFDTKTPYDLKIDKSFYSVEDVVNVAWLIGTGEKVASKQISILSTKDGLQQYWAAVGLFSQKSLTKKQLSSIASAYPAIKYKPAQMACMATLYKHSGNEKYRSEFEKLFSADSPEIAREGLQFVMTLDEKRQKSFTGLAKTLLADLKAKNNTKATYMPEYFCKMILYKYEGLPMVL